MPAPNAFSHNRKLSVFSSENKVVVFPVKHHNFLAKPDLFFSISPRFRQDLRRGRGEVLLP